jgi:hypothetical protein
MGLLEAFSAHTMLQVVQKQMSEFLASTLTNACIDINTKLETVRTTLHGTSVPVARPSSGSHVHYSHV